ncbi:MAG: hypothetical protein NT166_13695 [Candidatus Aminicenantes bacterium]|nr:hypothetical protein [Candidatus Aminicenantes bacterium]
MEENELSSISNADTLEKMGEFWDTHDFTDYDSPDAPDVEFKVLCTVPIEEELFSLGSGKGTCKKNHTFPTIKPLQDYNLYSAPSPG